MILPLPTGLSFEQWTAQLQNAYNKGFNFPNPYKEDKWWNWVEALMQLNPKGNIPVPSRSMYKKTEDWRKWAQFFLNNLNRN